LTGCVGIGALHHAINLGDDGFKRGLVGRTGEYRGARVANRFHVHPDFSGGGVFDCGRHGLVSRLVAGPVVRPCESLIA
jgi:hypothetical protein